MQSRHERDGTYRTNWKVSRSAGDVRPYQVASASVFSHESLLHHDLMERPGLHVRRLFGPTGLLIKMLRSMASIISCALPHSSRHAFNRMPSWGWVKGGPLRKGYQSTAPLSNTASQLQRGLGGDKSKPLIMMWANQTDKTLLSSSM